MTNLYSVLQARFPEDRSAVFARLPDGADLSYADVEARSAAYAHAVTGLGLKKGDRVAVQLEKTVEMLLVYLGCLRAGCIFLPLNPAYTVNETDHVVRDAAPALFICAPAMRQAMAGIAGVARVETLDGAGGGTLAGIARDRPATFDTLAMDDDDLAAILYTSGTTGKPKGAMLSHRNLASNALVLADQWRFTRDDVLLHALPIFHTHGLFVGTHVTLAAGASMIFLPGFDIDAIIRDLPAATVMMGVPTFYIRLLDDPRFDRETVRNIRLFISGSAPLSAEIHREFEDRTGHAILERYGMTETNMITSNPYDGERRPGSVGRPLPGISVRIADPETGADLPRGEVGMIEISGPNLFQGYWNMPEKTAAEFRDGYFISGDLGLIDEHGYVSIVGRQKDVIISGGYNVYPAEVEAALDELPQVREAAVVGVPHADMGEQVVCYVVPVERGFDDQDAVVGALRDSLSRYKQPRQIFFVDALPKNAMGKVQKTVLRQRYSNRQAS